MVKCSFRVPLKALTIYDSEIVNMSSKGINTLYEFINILNNRLYSISIRTL